MDGIGALAARETPDPAGPPDPAGHPDLAGPGCRLPAHGGPGTGDRPADRPLLSRAFSMLSAAPRQQLWRSQPSARDNVWVNMSQPPDDPETSWPSTVFNPFAADPDEMVVPTGPPTEDLVALPEASTGDIRLPMARRRHGRHAAPPASITGRLARKLAANR